MADKTIKIRAKAKKGSTAVKALITHPMETGKRKDKASGELVPAHFIQEVVCKHNGEEVLATEWGSTVSKNPFLSFSFEGGAKGDTVEIAWTDNTGAGDSAAAKIR